MARIRGPRHDSSRPPAADASLAASLVSADAVDDVAQEAVIDAVARLGEPREPAAARRWLWTVVRKHSDRHRRALRPTVLLDLDTHDLPVGVDTDPAEEDKVLGEAVRHAVVHAPDTDRLVLSLRYFSAWTIAELGALLGATPGSVRKRLHDARCRLRTHLATLADPATATSSGSPRSTVLSRPDPAILEEPMSVLPDLVGRILDPATAPPLPTAAPTPHRPASPRHPRARRPGPLASRGRRGLPR